MLASDEHPRGCFQKRASRLEDIRCPSVGTAAARRRTTPILSIGNDALGFLDGRFELERTDLDEVASLTCNGIKARTWRAEVEFADAPRKARRLDDITEIGRPRRSGQRRCPLGHPPRLAFDHGLRARAALSDHGPQAPTLSRRPLNPGRPHLCGVEWLGSTRMVCVYRTQPANADQTQHGHRYTLKSVYQLEHHVRTGTCPLPGRSEAWKFMKEKCLSG